jgi:putative transposase
MAEWYRTCHVAVWCYCLMPNHAHLIAVPKSEDCLRRAIGEAHRRYTRRVNFREGRRGHLWQGRFASFVMDEAYVLSAARYVELNPVRAKLAPSPEQYPWSSAKAHLNGQDDQLVKVAPLLNLLPAWGALLESGMSAEELNYLRRHEPTVRPVGDEGFLRRLEKRLGRVLHRLKPGPKSAARGYLSMVSPEFKSAARG